MACHQTFEGRGGEINTLSFDRNHRWYCVPRMTNGEVLLVKGCDSLVDGRARFIAHSVFDDPSTPSSAAPRKRIVRRAAVVYPHVS